MILSAGGGLKVHCLPLGELMTNCWVLAIEQEQPSPCWVIDPDDDGPVIDFLAKRNYVPQRIVITHGHGDHIRGIAGVKQRYPQAIITASAGDAHMLTDPVANLSMLLGVKIVAPPAEQTVQPGDELTLGGTAFPGCAAQAGKSVPPTLTWKVLDLAGHTAGGVGCYSQQAGVVVVGDALFADSIGRTDFPGCSGKRLLANIHNHLMTLPDATRVLPGHGAPTTIGQERLNNPYLQQE